MALPAGAASLDEADAAIELWEFYKKRKLDDGQRLDVYVMMATRADGLWAAGVTGHEKPRQSGKGDAIEVVEFWGLTQRSERILHTIHDAVLLATETQSRMLSLFEHPDLRRLKSRAWKGTGQQMIEMRDGGIIWYRTRTGAGGRGVDEVDRLVIDEAQHAEQQHTQCRQRPQRIDGGHHQEGAAAGVADDHADGDRDQRRDSHRDRRVLQMLQNPGTQPGFTRPVVRGEDVGQCLVEEVHAVRTRAHGVISRPPSRIAMSMSTASTKIAMMPATI